MLNLIFGTHRAQAGRKKERKSKAVKFFASRK
jgi:hypothetical protein